MSPGFKRTVCAVGALIAGLLVAEGSSRLKAVRDTTLLANGESKKPPTTSTGRELTGPGTHHEEYIVPREDTGRVRVDTVRDRRLWMNEDGDTLSGDTLKRRAPPPPPIDSGKRGKR
jgi:hypothetical protein